MFIKKFEVNSFEEGLTQIKKELGPDALIVKTVRKKVGVFGKSQIEITAAVKRPKSSVDPSLELKIKKESLENFSLAQIFPHREKEKKHEKGKVQPQVKYIDVEDSKSNKDLRALPRKRYAEDFTRLGISSSLASELVYLSSNEQLNQEHAHHPEADPRASILSKRVKTVDLIELSKKNRVAFVGTAGSGKTMAWVKLALALKQRSQPIALSSLDGRKVSSSFELHQYGKILKVPVKKIDESEGREIQLVDTPSLRLDSEESNWDLVKRLGKKPTSFVLCLEATLRLTEMIRIFEVAQRFFHVDGIFISKLDLATLTGVVFELSYQTKVPICGINTSQSFNAPLEFLNPTQLSQMIIQRGVTS